MKYTGDFEAPIGMKLLIVQTGEWRSFRPVSKREKCSKCGTCWLYCPTQCIRVYETYLAPDLEFCKGCGICAYECPSQVITMMEEEREIG